MKKIKDFAVVSVNWGKDIFQDEKERLSQFRGKEEVEEKKKMMG